MTPKELTDARLRLGLSKEQLAAVLPVSGIRTIDKWESGQRGIPDTVATLIEVMLEFPGVRKYLVSKINSPIR